MVWPSGESKKKLLTEIAHTSYHKSEKGPRFLLLIQLFSSEKQKCPDHCVYSETGPPPPLSCPGRLSQSGVGVGRGGG